MTTECTEVSFDFQPLANREVTARFDGGTITSDAGGLLLRELEEKTGIIRRFAQGFEDFRDPDLAEFSVLELLKQRIFALCLGYEDLNDRARPPPEARPWPTAGRQEYAQPAGTDAAGRFHGEPLQKDRRAARSAARLLR